MLLNLQPIGTQKKRALDMAELRLRAARGFSSFQCDHCLVAMRSSSRMSIGPLFGRIGEAFMGVRLPSLTFQVKGGFSYL